jgi:peptidoglycan hydrolase-like protein with peptidoglycan-binding domain
LKRVVPFSVALFAAFAIGAWAGGPSPQTSTTKKKSSAKPTAKAAAKTTVKTAPKASTAAAKSKSKRPPVTAHHYAPQQPSVERYKEIQQALATRGYFKTEPDGTWGPASMDALKRFQHDQNLVEDGKIGSLSLIALGLGPKREPPEPVKTAEPEQRIP